MFQGSQKNRPSILDAAKEYYIQQAIKKAREQTCVEYPKKEEEKNDKAVE
jgi:hypothetical protein